MEMQVTWQNYPGKGQYVETVYTLDEHTIDEVVPDNCPHGNYRILRFNPMNETVNVIYVGRVANRTSDAGLKDRLKEHVNEWQGILYFDFEIQPTAIDAYQQECWDFHNWNTQHNDSHPAKLPYRNDPCPVCGQ